MKFFLKTIAVLAATVFISACSVFGNSGVEIASYNVLEQDGPTEIRHYDSLVLVTTEMPGGMDEGQNEAFQRLFKYISGENEPKREIAMTAPVIMKNQDPGQKIEMTAPVFISNQDENQTMSFVLPVQYDFQTAPKPSNSAVHLQEIKDYTVAALKFSGLLNEKNIQRHHALLQNWIDNSHYQETGSYMTAGYNPPWTLPFLRRNEVLIPVEKK
jgi:hypothetical protein